MNVDDIRIRCSSLGYIMTEPRSKKETISDTCKTHLVDVFVSANYGRREDKYGKYIEKGNQREEDSITLLSRVNRVYYRKNKERLEDEFISGEPDIFIGESIRTAEEIYDTKTSWSAHTFFRQSIKDLPDEYKWQGVGYMRLTGARRHTVAFCLVNGTVQAIEDEKRKLSYQMGVFDKSGAEVPEAYLERCRQIEINHIFDLQEFMSESPFYQLDNDPSCWRWDIPKEKRVRCFAIERLEDEISAVEDRVKECRKWINENLKNL
jgi:hypothetical protein